MNEVPLMTCAQLRDVLSETENIMSNRRAKQLMSRLGPNKIEVHVESLVMFIM